LADPLGLVSLQQGWASRAFREEEVGIGVTARGSVTPILDVAHGC